MVVHGGHMGAPGHVSGVGQVDSVRRPILSQYKMTCMPAERHLSSSCLRRAARLQFEMLPPMTGLMTVFGGAAHVEVGGTVRVWRAGTLESAAAAGEGNEVERRFQVDGTKEASRVPEMECAEEGGEVSAPGFEDETDGGNVVWRFVGRAHLDYSAEDVFRQ
eukprot:3715801-Rhodomonas_salina.2